MGSDEQGRLRLTFDLDDSSPAVEDASASLTPEEIKEARRLLRAGEAATDPRVARLVVALAEKERDGDVRMLIGWLLSFFFAVATLALLATHPLNGKTITVAAVAAVTVSANVVHTRIRLRYPDAERENRLVLDSYRIRPPAAPTPPVVQGPLQAVRRSAFIVPVTLVASVIESVVEHGHVTGHALLGGLVLGGVLMTGMLIRGWFRAHPNA